MKKKFIFWLAKKWKIDIVDSYDKVETYFVKTEREIVEIRSEFKIEYAAYKELPYVQREAREKLKQEVMNNIFKEELIETVQYEDSLTRSMHVRFKIDIVKPIK